MNAGELAVKFNNDLSDLIDRGLNEGVAPITIQMALQDNAFEMASIRLDRRREAQAAEVARRIVPASALPSNGK